MEATRMQMQEAPRQDHGRLPEEITRSVVHLYKEYAGQGPTKARTYLTEDVVVCVLQGGFTRAERTLLERGQAEAVIHQRRALDEALRLPLSDAIGRLLERRVVGFTGAVQPDTELSTVVFLLEPAGSGRHAAPRVLAAA